MLITGAGGGVGTFAVQLAKAFGAEVTGACGPAKVDLVRSLGADRVIDRTQEDFADGRERYDLILDNAGIRPVAELRRALTPEGTLVIVGGEGGGRWLGGFQRQILWAPLSGRRVKALTSKERREDLLFLNPLFEAGEVTPVVERTYPLAETRRGDPPPRDRRGGRQARHNPQLGVTPLVEWGLSVPRRATATSAPHAATAAATTNASRQLSASTIAPASAEPIAIPPTNAVTGQV